MSKVICAISSITFQCEHIPLTLSHREYSHPIFYLPQKKLLGLYSLYIKDKLTTVDSYLLFLALMNSTDSVTWVAPANPDTLIPQIVASNIAQLVKAIWETNAIMHPSFKQPAYIVRADNSDLHNISIWIKALNKNIEQFKYGRTSAKERESIQKVENTLSYLINSPNTEYAVMGNALANWAELSADFPASKAESWKKIIRTCHRIDTMFFTPKVDLEELKAYCEENLEIGSIHFHKLLETLRLGIANHNDYLGLNTLKTKGDCGYSLISDDSEEARKNEQDHLLSIIEAAPESAPIESNYGTKAAYLKAKVAFMLSKSSTSSHLSKDI